MILVGKYSLKPWIRGLALAPKGAAVVVILKTYHRNAPAEVLSVEATANLRKTLLAWASTGRLSAAIRQHATTGTAVQLASIETRDLTDAKGIAGALLSPERSARGSDGGKPDVTELLVGVRKLHRQIVSQEDRRALAKVRNLLKRLG